MASMHLMDVSIRAANVIRENPVLTAIALVVLYFLNGIYNTPLRNIPGPPLASLSRLWKVRKILTERQEIVMLNLHQKYGTKFKSS